MNSSPPSTLHLAVACDSHDLTGAIGSLASVRLAVPLDTGVEVVFLHGGLSSQEQDRVHAAMARLKGSPQIRFVTVDVDFASIPGFSSGSSMSYARLLLPEEASMDRLVYMDVDMLVLKDLRKLATGNLPASGVAGSLDETKPAIAGDMPEVQPVPLDSQAPYLNAGLLALDLEKVKTSGIFTKALNILREFPASCRWHDQSALNYALNGGFSTLDPSWNRQNHRACFDPAGMIPQLAARACNVHFVSKAKPWLAHAPFPAEEMFRMLLNAVDPRWKEDPFTKAMLAGAHERYASVLPTLLSARAMLKKLTGKDASPDTQAARVWKQFNQDVNRIEQEAETISTLYGNWQIQIQNALAKK